MFCDFSLKVYGFTHVSSLLMDVVILVLRKIVKIRTKKENEFAEEQKI